MIEVLEQPLYSRKKLSNCVKGYDSKRIRFFDYGIGSQIENENRVATVVDTNMDSVGMLVNKMFKVTGFKLCFSSEPEIELILYLMKYGALEFSECGKICYRLGISMMENHCFFFEKDIKIPIVIGSYENFYMDLCLMKKFHHEYDYKYFDDVELLLELKGYLRNVF